MKVIRILSLLLPLLVSIGAAAQQTDNEDDGKLQQFVQQCRARYAETDALIDKAGVRDGGFYRVPGFPFLRTDRLLSSFGDELGDINTLGTWMLQLREYDGIARDAELQNLGMAKQPRADLLNDLRLCAVWMSFDVMADEAALKKLRTAVRVPDDYLDDSPQAVASLKALEAARRNATQVDFSAPLDAKTPLTLWQPTPVADDSALPQDFHEVLRDELGRVGLLMSAWPALAAKHAPQLLIESQGRADALGTPVWRGSKRGLDVDIDTTTPVVYYQPGYARVDGRMLVQVSYFLWLPAQTAKARRGVDSLIWRVTLNENGEPLMYDSVRANGLDPLWFPVPGVKPRAGATESVLMPQAPPQQAFALRLKAGDHALVRLQTIAETAVNKPRRYTLRTYDDLATLPTPQGGTRNLFDSAAVVPGIATLLSRDYARVGIRHLGSVRQWNHLAIALSSRRHFDDPFLIGSLFELPPVSIRTAKN